MAVGKVWLVVNLVCGVSVGVDLDPWAGVVDDDELMAGGDDGDFLGLVVWGDVNDGVVEDSCACGAVIARERGFLFLGVCTWNGERERNEECGEYEELTHA